MERNSIGASCVRTAKGGIKISVAEKSLVKKAENQIAKNKKKCLDIGLLVTIFVLLRLGTNDGFEC